MKSSAKAARRASRAQPEFVLKAGRALRRAAGKVRAENQKLGLPLIGWQDGKVTEFPTAN